MLTLNALNRASKMAAKRGKPAPPLSKNHSKRLLCAVELRVSSGTLFSSRSVSGQGSMKEDAVDRVISCFVEQNGCYG